MIQWAREASQRTGFRGALIGDNLYKIVKYYYIGKHPASRRDVGAAPGYHAYFKPAGWPNWGNSVSFGCGYFTTIDKAKRACEEHYQAYGDKPAAHDKIVCEEVTKI